MAMPAEKLGLPVAGIGHRPFILADLKRTDTEAWLSLRECTLGASEVAAALGLNPYKSPLKLYLEKMGHREDLSGNEAVEFGVQMEGPIRQWFAKRYPVVERFNVEVQEYPFMLRHPDHYWLSASPDGVITHPELGVGLIEIKTASERMWREWEADELPTMYYIQIQSQLAVTGLDYAYVVALVGRKLLWKFVPRNDEVIDQIIDLTGMWWRDHIEAKIPPAPEGLPSDTAALKLLYPEATPDVVQLHHLQDDYDRYKDLQTRQKELGLEIEAIKQRFMAEMGSADTAMVGKKKVTWKMVERKEYVVQASCSRQLRIF